MRGAYMRWSEGRFLDEYVDEELEVDEGWKSEDEQARQVGRLSRCVAVILVAHSMPRRLGGGASDEELRADKLMARRVGSRLSNSLTVWAGGALDVSDDAQVPEVKQEGAQIEWSKWWAEHRRKVEVEIYRVATTCRKLGHKREGNVMVNRLLNEIKTLDEVLGSPSG